MSAMNPSARITLTAQSIDPLYFTASPDVIIIRRRIVSIGYEIRPDVIVTTKHQHTNTHSVHALPVLQQKTKDIDQPKQKETAASFLEILTPSSPGPSNYDMDVERMEERWIKLTKNGREVRKEREEEKRKEAIKSAPRSTQSGYGLNEITSALWLFSHQSVKLYYNPYPSWSSIVHHNITNL